LSAAQQRVADSAGCGGFDACLLPCFGLCNLQKDAHESLRL